MRAFSAKTIRKYDGSTIRPNVIGCSKTGFHVPFKAMLIYGIHLWRGLSFGRALIAISTATIFQMMCAAAGLFSGMLQHLNALGVATLSCGSGSKNGKMKIHEMMSYDGQKVDQFPWYVS